MSTPISPKVTAAAAAAAAVAITVWIIETTAGLIIPVEVTLAAGVLLTFTAGWAMPDPTRRGRHAAD